MDLDEQAPNMSSEDPVDAELRSLFGEHLSVEDLRAMEAGPARRRRTAWCQRGQQNCPIMAPVVLA